MILIHHHCLQKQKISFVPTTVMTSAPLAKYPFHNREWQNKTCKCMEIPGLSHVISKNEISIYLSVFYWSKRFYVGLVKTTLTWLEGLIYLDRYNISRWLDFWQFNGSFEPLNCCCDQSKKLFVFQKGGKMWVLCLISLLSCRNAVPSFY